MRSITRVVFCPNQIAATLALGMVKEADGSSRLVVVYWPDRCDVSALRAQGVACHAYSRVACLKVLLYCRLRGGVECVVPHRRLGRVVNGFAALCSSVALVDDGLDTLRDVPRNINPEDFPAGTTFYTFAYSGALGMWLGKFKVRPVATISMLGDTGRPRINLRGVRRLVIESPPLETIQETLELTDPSTLVVIHSNVKKQTLKCGGVQTVSGANVNIEKSLDAFVGEVVIGESMVAVYALLIAQRAFTLKIHLTAAQASNLAPLIAMVAANAPNVSLVVGSRDITLQ